jgi:hypothetical protein
MVKRTNFPEKDIAIALELICKQANLPDLALECCVAMSSPAPTILFWIPYNAFKEQRRSIQASNWFHSSPAPPTCFRDQIG